MARGKQESRIPTGQRLCSPVLHKMLCGSFIESNRKKLQLNDVDGEAFSKVLDIWCGKESCPEIGLEGIGE
jgi:hypothetical protein